MVYPGVLYDLLYQSVASLGAGVWALYGLVVAGLFACLAVLVRDGWRQAYGAASEADGVAARSGLSPGQTRWLMGGVLVSLVLLRLPDLLLPEQNVDEGQWLVSAATLLRDPRIFLSVSPHTTGPLAIYVLTLPGLAGVPLSYALVRLTSLVLLQLPMLVLLYAAARRVGGTLVARLGVAATVLLLAFLRGPDTIAYNSEYAVAGLTAAAFWLAVRVGEEAWPRLWRVASLGLVLGLFPYARVQAAPIGVAFALWGMAVLWRGGVAAGVSGPGEGPGEGATRWRRLGVLVLGGLLPTLVLAMYLAAIDRLDDAWLGYVVNAVQYASSGLDGVGTTQTVWQRLAVLVGIMALATETAQFYGGSLIAIAAGLAVAWYHRAALRPGLRWQLALGLGVWLAAAFCIIKPGNTFGHYLNLLLVPTVYLLVVLLAVLRAHAPPPRWLRALAGWCAAAYLALVVVGALLEPSPGLALARQEAPLAPQRVALRVRELAPPGETLVVWGWNHQLYVQSGRTTGVRDPNICLIVNNPKLRKYLQRRYVADLERSSPGVFVDTAGMATSLMDRDPRYRLANYPHVAVYIAEHYVPVAECDGARIHLRRDLAAAVPR